MTTGSLRLKDLRDTKDITQKYMAEEFGRITGKPMRQSTYSRIESGDMALTYHTARVFVQILNEAGVKDGNVALEDLAEFETETWTTPTQLPQKSLMTA